MLMWVHLGHMLQSDYSPRSNFPTTGMYEQNIPDSYTIR